MFALILSLLLLSSASTTHGASIQYNEGSKFTNIVWFHFPKTGGTTLRSIVYNYVRDNNLNMTSDYGVPEQNIRFSHNRGSPPNFMYGHVRDKFVDYASQPESACLGSREDSKDSTLYVFMIREPTSWLFSRYLHHHHFFSLGLAKQEFQNISEFAMTYSQEYLEFLDDETRAYSLKWFKESMTVASGGVVPIPNTYKASPFLSPSDIGRAFERKLLRCRNSIVLVQDYFGESLGILDRAFGTKHFTDYLKTDRRINKLANAHVAPLTSLDVNSLNRIMQVHHVIYQVCLNHFFDSYYNTGVPAA